MIEQMMEYVAITYPEISVVLLGCFDLVGTQESGLIGEEPKSMPNNLMP